MDMTIIKDKNLYYVGGVVRDEFLGTKNFDIDLCYEGNAIEYAEKKGLSIVKINPEFGTVRVLSDGKEIDIASTREETYPRKGHLPKVYNIGCSLNDDLKRRDFTINAIAKNTVTGEIYDPFNGLNDIKLKLLKVLHKDSFVDDPTRIVRGLKFSVRFDFNLDKTTKALQDNYLNNINYDMSYHRLKKELVETFNLNNAKAIDEFVNHGVYKLLGPKQTLPKIRGEVIQKAIENTSFTPWLIYMAFFDLSNLPLTKNEKRIIDWVEKLDEQNITNNTPKESILIRKLMEAKC